MDDKIKITNERVVGYINSLNTKNSDICEEIEEEARNTRVPIIRKETENFLKVLLQMNKPSNILEVGTAVGYSALLISENAPSGSHVTTIELDHKRAVTAKANVERAGRCGEITVIEGDAAKILPEIKEIFDFIFLDAAKGQYGSFWKDLVRLCRPGGVIVTDNVLQEGTIIESKFMIEQRDRTIHMRMREFLYDLTHDDKFITSIVPIGDGMAVSVKKGDL